MKKLILSLLLISTTSSAQEYGIISVEEADGGIAYEMAIMDAQDVSMGMLDDVKLYPPSARDTMRNSRTECSCVTNIPGVVKDYRISSLDGCYELEDRMFEYKPSGSRTTAKGALLKCGPIEKTSGYRPPAAGGVSLGLVEQLQSQIASMRSKIDALESRPIASPSRSYSSPGTSIPTADPRFRVQRPSTPKKPEGWRNNILNH